MGEWEKTARALAAAIELVAVVVEKYRDERSNQGVRSAADALTVIAAITDAARLGDGPPDPDKIREGLDRLQAALTGNDEDADQKLREKFRT